MPCLCARRVAFQCLSGPRSVRKTCRIPLPFWITVCAQDVSHFSAFVDHGLCARRVAFHCLSGSRSVRKTCRIPVPLWITVCAQDVSHSSAFVDHGLPAQRAARDMPLRVLVAMQMQLSHGQGAHEIPRHVVC
eukprot:354359-Chlamydomonas_euryale.AAC.3